MSGKPKRREARGRYKKKELSLPDWFKLEKYEGLINLEPERWNEQLAAR